MWQAASRYVVAICLIPTSLAMTAAGGDESPLPGWQEMLFEGRTRYRDTGDCVEAVSESSASGLIREVNADISVTPVLEWGWYATEPLRADNPASEKLRAGDDFLARVYVIREGFFRWQTRAINYVWSREQPVGSHWHNPFSENAVMVVVQSGKDGLDEWRHFRREIRADFRRFHDMEVEQIDAVAIMTDTDNTGGRARACYRMPRLLTK